MLGKRCIVFILAACFAAGGFPESVRAADDPAAALLAKHAAYAGWRGGDGSIKTLREAGDVTRDGKVLEGLNRLQMRARSGGECGALRHLRGRLHGPRI